MLVSIERRLARRTPVYDHADELLYFVDRDTARQLMTREYVCTIGTSRRVRALRFRGPEAPSRPGSGRRRKQAGEPHRHETNENVNGCWHIDRIPVSCQPHFVAVVQQCLKA